jgi:hypothetical protein
MLTTTKDQQEILETIKNNYVEWGAPTLTWEQYIEREMYLAGLPFSKGQTTWIYKVEDQIVSACETYNRPCIAKINGTIVRGECMSIASVYTPQKYRQKGYATSMLRNLLQDIKSRPNVMASTLYSDIGPNYYHKMGWEFTKSQSLVIHVDYTKEYPQTCSLVHYQAIDSIVVNIVDDLMSHMPNNSFAVLPTSECITWMFSRSMYYAKLLFPNRLLESAGITHGSDSFFWFFEFKESKCYVTLCTVSSVESATLMLGQIHEIAKSWGLKEIHIWSPSAILIEAANNGVFEASVIDRQDSLSSLAYFTGNEKLSWVLNEKFAWV